MSEERLKDLLDETRLVMLGAQLLLGLQYRAVFMDAFEHLPSPFAAFDAVALLLSFITALYLVPLIARRNKSA